MTLPPGCATTRDALVVPDRNVVRVDRRVLTLQVASHVQRRVQHDGQLGVFPPLLDGAYVREARQRKHGVCDGDTVQLARGENALGLGQRVRDGRHECVARTESRTRKSVAALSKAPDTYQLELAEDG